MTQRQGVEVSLVDSQDMIRGTEPEAFSTNIWPQLDDGAWKPELLTANEYCFHHESILPEVTERWDMEHRGLINFMESDFFNGYSCKYCPEVFYDIETHKKGKHSQNHYFHHCQIKGANRPH